MELIKLIILFFGGLAGGLYASTVGGGGLLSFPLLIFVGLPVHLAIGTQRLSAVILELASALKFHSARKLKVKLSLILGIIAAIGAVIGANLVLKVDEKILNIVVSIILPLAAFIVFNKDKLKIKADKTNRKHLLILALITFPIGIYGGFFGPGWGVIITIFLVLFGFGYMESAAMARAIGFIMSVAGTIVFARNGFINYAYGLTLGAGFAIGSVIGINIALKKNEGYVKSLLFVVILLTSGKLILNFFGIKFI